MDISGYWRAIRKYWWMVVSTLALCLAISALVTISTERKYASSVTFFVNTPSDTIAGSAQGDTFGQKRVNSYVQLIGTSSLGRLVADDLDNGMTAEQVSAEISAKGDLNTVLLTATVTDSSAQRSLEIARSVATQFVALVSGIERADGAASATVRLEVVDGPSLNDSPVQPLPIRNLGIGALAGLLLGLGAAVGRDLLDTSIRSTADLARASRSPGMGVIPFDEAAKFNPIISADQQNSIRAEAFRQLRTNLQFVSATNPVKVLVVTSSVSGEGKSTTAANLAITFSLAGLKVLLIEGDLRRPRVVDYLGLEGAVGLTNVLVGQVDVSEVLQRWGENDLDVLASGSIPPNPSELLGSQAMKDLITQFRAQFDVVVIDTPPLLPVTDAAIVTTYCDGALLVARHGTTTQSQVASSMHSLESVDARVFGTVLNMAPTRGAEARGYGYGYNYDDENSDRTKLELNSIPNTNPSAEKMGHGE